ncbi:oxidoreductase [Spirosoma fluviale]|uniref:NAD(P)-dependent dehydrogenase, short-chain alcohol dehydrogenase family n=1 Tax=Spirosoma fluviale TaxID=1597977 RepID=A0A286GU63_9BACT|nr:oxidoreductase [Spirosoma fluviale]SOD99071.1 NAD(P)-dependent dehydrogenase, short-chain alcohol dehydrogenase family [Spirosoma fluviale]
MGEKWSMDRVGSLSGKVAVITGASSGIGYETALGLAKKDITVILGCRDLTKAQKAKSAIIYHYPTAQIDCLPIDTSSLRSVSAFATLVETRYGKLDLLINNAGIMMSPYHVTEDGFENQFATNYLGHFALTGLLLPLLKSVPGSRVVTLTSLSYKWAEIDFDDLQAKKGYSRRTAYGQSKRACLIFAYELQRRLAGAGYNVRSVAAHPGLAKTNLDKYFPALIRPLGSLFLQPARQGALPVLYAALETAINGGEFVGPNGFQQIRGYPGMVDSDDYSTDIKVAGRLWKASESLTNVSYLS